MGCRKSPPGTPVVGNARFGSSQSEAARGGTLEFQADGSLECCPRVTEGKRVTSEG